jgi:hypothetical protein
MIWTRREWVALVLTVAWSVWLLWPRYETCYAGHFARHPLHLKDPPGCYATEAELDQAMDKSIDDAVDEHVRPAFEQLDRATEGLGRK